MNLSKNYNRKN